ncbi:MULTISPECIES: OmpA family protein [Streptomyces]|uniref:OmpA family protein n=1 Tax=Streptomyces TaxID=1883 RepID=UPI000F54EF2B|nr:OmpA family protein [Streptomyces sp. ADI97-07]
MTHLRIQAGVARLVSTALAVSLLSVGVTVVGAASAQADDGPSVPPGTEASAEPPVKTDGNDPDLKMPEGGTLAPGKVLDIIQVVEDLGGEERREDTNADIKFALQAEVLFGKDSAKLSSEANARIIAIAAEIEKQNASKVRIFGFTDDLGSSAHGDVLSKERAEAVNGVLSKELGTTITFEIRGYGEQYPIADNSTEEGRKKNRRVEVSFPRTTN